MAGRRINGGIIGATNGITNGRATGIWSFSEQFLGKKNNGWPVPPPPTFVILIVAGGGGGGGGGGGNGGTGGGGAGGFRELSLTIGYPKRIRFQHTFTA